MLLNRWQWVSFSIGLALLLLGGILFFRNNPEIQLTPGAGRQSAPVSALPDAAPAQLGDLEFRTDREKRSVIARRISSGEQVWESQGSEGWIVPGAAFPLDISPEGQLWVANVGRKRLEQLDPETGQFIASWEPREAFSGCCNPVRFAALAGGRFLTMEKGVRQARLYAPSGELLKIIVPDLSGSEFNYQLRHTPEKVYLLDNDPKSWQPRVWELDAHE